MEEQNGSRDRAYYAQRAAEELELALDHLRPDYRRCFELFYRQELSVAEVGERLGIPQGTVKTWLHRARKELVEHLERQRFAKTPQPRASTPPASRSRHVPAAVRRHVWQRDGGRCAFVGVEGRCRETGCLEFHHVEPYAVGGDAAADNIELRCRAHNTHEARLYFGADVSGRAATPHRE